MSEFREKARIQKITFPQTGKMDTSNSAKTRKRPFRDINKTPTHSQEDLEGDTASEQSMVEEDNSEELAAWEEAIRDEARQWIAASGRALFSLECQRFLVNERKRKEQLSKR